MPGSSGLGGRRVAVTGGAGFIGSHLVGSLVAAGAAVELLGPPVIGRREVAELVAAGAVRHHPDIVAGDGGDRLEHLLNRCDSLVHLAHTVPTASGWWHRLREEIGLNLLHTVSVLDAADRSGVSHVCFASSVAVYGSTLERPHETDMPAEPLSPYAVAKLAAEQCVRCWVGEGGRRSAAILRLATVYGPGETVPRAIPTFIRQVLDDRPAVVHGRGQKAFDAIFVGDVAEAFTRACERRASGTFNIGTGVGHTPREIAEAVIALCGSNVGVQHDPTQPERGGPICDVSAAAEVLGFSPRTPLEVGLRREIDWLSQTRSAAASG